MRRKFFPLFLIIAAACAPDRREMRPVEITVDPRIELMGVVQWLGAYLLSTQYNFQYRREVEEWFGNYRSHPAVTTFIEMSQRGFSYDAVPKAMLAYGPPPEMAKPSSLPAGTAERAGGEARLDEFMSLLADFADTTNFTGFFEANRSFYDSVIAYTDSQARSAVAMLDNYLGTPVGNSTLVLGLLLHHGGFSVLFDSEGDAQAWAILGPAGATDDRPMFGDQRRIGRIVWHEFAHTVINPLTARHRTRVEELHDLMEPIEDTMRLRGYTVWETVVNEHIARALTARLLAGLFGDEVAQTSVDSDVSLGFRYMEPLVGALTEYEAKRDQYREIGSFYDVLLDSLEVQRER